MQKLWLRWVNKIPKSTQLISVGTISNSGLSNLKALLFIAHDASHSLIENDAFLISTSYTAPWESGRAVSFPPQDSVVRVNLPCLSHTTTDTACWWPRHLPLRFHLPKYLFGFFSQGDIILGEEHRSALGKTLHTESNGSWRSHYPAQ